MKFKKTLIFFFVMTAILFFIPGIRYMLTNLSMQFQIEGPFKDINFRDAGKSLNECAGKEIFKEQKFLRVSRFFSGWSCERVGNPDHIISLNYHPEKRKKFFCLDGNDEPLIGEIHNNPDIELANIEFLSSWKNQQHKESTCRAIYDVLRSIASGQKLLLHCDAGRDRTGTLTAMISTMLAEQKGYQTEELIAAAECDYEKTKSLSEDKHGRMVAFLSLLNQIGIKQFIMDQCSETADFNGNSFHITEQLIAKAANQYVNEKK